MQMSNKLYAGHVDLGNGTGYSSPQRYGARRYAGQRDRFVFTLSYE